MRHIEDEHQKTVIDWAKLKRVVVDTIPNARLERFLIHIPNGGKRGKREAERLKAQGVKAGVSDLLLALPRGYYSGLWVEMKRPIVKGESKPKPTDAQLDWLDDMRAVGYAAHVCYGAREAIDVIENYLSLGGKSE